MVTGSRQRRDLGKRVKEGVGKSEKAIQERDCQGPSQMKRANCAEEKSRYSYHQLKREGMLTRGT